MAGRHDVDGSRFLEAARHRGQHFCGPDPPGQRAQGDQPLAGVSGFRLRSRAGRRRRQGDARRPQPVRADARRAGAARGDRREGRAALRAEVRPGHRSRRHLRRDRGPVRDADHVRAARRRGRAVRAVLRLVRAGDSPERRHAGVRQPALSGLLGELGRGPARDHAAHARDSRQHAAQPDRHDLVGGRHAAARVDRRRHRTSS